MTNNPQALRAAAAALTSAADMLEHNDAIFKGKWKKGSKAWSGDFIERTVQEGLANIGATREASPSSAVTRGLTDEQIMNAALKAADALDATRVSEMRAGKWHATTIFDGDAGLLRFGRLVEVLLNAAPQVPEVREAPGNLPIASSPADAAPSPLGGLAEVVAEYDRIVGRLDRPDPEADFVMRGSDWRTIRAAISMASTVAATDEKNDFSRWADAMRLLDRARQKLLRLASIVSATPADAFAGWPSKPYETATEAEQLAAEIGSVNTIPPSSVRSPSSSTPESTDKRDAERYRIAREVRDWSRNMKDAKTPEQFDAAVDSKERL